MLDFINKFVTYLNNMIHPSIPTLLYQFLKDKQLVTLLKKNII